MRFRQIMNVCILNLTRGLGFRHSFLLKSPELYYQSIGLYCYIVVAHKNSYANALYELLPGATYTALTYC